MRISSITLDLRQFYRIGLAVILAFSLFAGSVASAQQVKAPAVPDRVAMPDSVRPAVKNATLLRHLDPQQKFKAQIAFNFRDPQAAEAFAYSVSNPSSPQYRQFLTPQEVGQQFGPMPADYQAAKDFAAANGLSVTKEWPNRLTITVEGTVSQIEKAFGTTINEYREGRSDFLNRPKHGAEPMVFYANATPITVPSNIAAALSGVVGLENYTRPIPRSKRLSKKSSAGPMSPVMLEGGYNVVPLYTLGGNYGSGRTVGISSFDKQNHATNAPDYVNHFGLPTPSGGAGSNVSVVTVDGGNGTGNGQGEGDLDYQMVLAMAPLATIIIYDTGHSDLLECYQTEANANVADIITESYGWSGLTGSAATSYHNEHVTMAMQGQTYCNASGDTGSNYKYSWPDIDPDSFVVGGTEMTVSGTTAPVSWVSELAWDDSVGSSTGGYDTSHTYTQPTWQVGRGVGSSGYRQFPDIALEAGTGTSSYYANYFYYNGGLTEADGTSCASPMNAGALAVVETYLISLGELPLSGAGFSETRLGLIAPAIYAMNGRNDVFHDITSGSNGGYSCTPYWDYVTGWGSVNYYNLAVALPTPLAVNVTPVNPTILYGATQQCAATVAGSNNQAVTWSLVSGPTGSSVSSTGLFTAPATGTTTTTAVVKATWTGDYAAPGATSGSPLTGTTTITIEAAVTASGTVTLQNSVNAAQSITFTIQSTANLSNITTQTLTLTSTGAGAPTGTFTLTGLAPGTYNIGIKGSKWLQTVVSNVTVTSNVTGITASLLGGDLNGDNVVNLEDFNILAAAFGSNSSNSNWNANADINCDGVVSLLDFDILAGNFGLTGQSLP